MFDEQIHALRSLSKLYDSGNAYIAPFIGIVIRNIFEELNHKHSLWELKFGADKLFCDSATAKTRPPQNYTISPTYNSEGSMQLPNVVITGTEKVYDGFLKKVISKEGEYNLYPLLDERKDKVKWKTFEEWMNQVIFAVNDVTFTRRQAIEVVAASEGNLSGTLPDNYALFRAPTALQILVNGQPVKFNQNPVFVSIRQIAWELQETLRRIEEN